MDPQTTLMCFLGHGRPLPQWMQQEWEKTSFIETSDLRFLLKLPFWEISSNAV